MAESIADLLMRVWDTWKATSPVKQGDVSQEQYRILKVLAEQGPLKVKELASRVGTSPSSASTTVKRLAKAGTVQRARQKDDERVVSVRLTDKGREKIDSWRERQLAALSSLFEVLEKTEKETMRSMLARVVEGAER